MKIMTIFGTRPEAIKMAPVIKALREERGVSVHVCVTAQHREMLDDVLESFSIRPDADLDLMRPGQGLCDVTVGVLGGITKVLREVRPDIVLVHGDTTTTFSASLAAFYERIPVGHVEAGLRSGDIRSPWPEEANRKLTACLADIHFAPTERQKDHLLKEGIPSAQVQVVGNTVIDAMLEAVALLEAVPAARLEEWFPWRRENSPLVLVTCHRRENFGAPLARICAAVRRIADERPDVDVVLPVHPNPQVGTAVRQALEGVGNVHLIEPQSYLPFVWLMRTAAVILTDSGGIQEEAPTFCKRILVLRDNTERHEVVEAGMAILVGSDEHKIHEECLRALDSAPPVEATNPYGDGKASSRIVKALRELVV